MKRILVPLDGTVFAEQALPTAVSIARRHHSTLELVLVDETWTGGGLESWPWALSTARSHQDYIANHAARLSDAGSDVEHTVADGRAANEICRLAVEKSADLIVMMSRGHTGFARMLGGSVADAVIRHSGIPVLVLRELPLRRRVRKTAVHIERILIAMDGSAESFAALHAAVELTDHGVTELHLVEVVAPVPLSTLDSVRRIMRIDRLATQHMVDRADARLEALRARVASRTGCDVYAHVMAYDDPARGILRTAHGFNASVIAMGTHGRGASRLFMGSVAEHVLGDGRYPMLLVHPSSAAMSPEQERWERERDGDASLRSG